MFVAHPTYMREKARQVRRDKHLTIDELAERLAVSRTTVYYWVRDLPIPITAAQSLAQRRASKSIRRKALMLREAAYDEGLESFAFFSPDPLFRDFICMYIGEGYKRCRNRVTICNSDPAVLRLAKPWFDRFSRNPVTLSVQYHADQDLSGIQAFLGSRTRRCAIVNPTATQVEQRPPVWSRLALRARGLGDDHQRHPLPC
jgi:DNA-binding XRE family transcriptional regulator